MEGQVQNIYSAKELDNLTQRTFILKKASDIHTHLVRNSDYYQVCFTSWIMNTGTMLGYDCQIHCKLIRWKYHHGL